MTLVLTVASYRGQPPAQQASQRFDGTMITVGRGPDNDWVLPDPEQHLSKRHCVIQRQGGQYQITDTSTNGVFIGGQLLGNGQSAPLRDGDRVVIGDYELAVGVGSGAEPADGFGVPEVGPGGFGLPSQNLGGGFADPGAMQPFPSMSPGLPASGDGFGLGAFPGQSPPSSPAIPADFSLFSTEPGASGAGSGGPMAGGMGGFGNGPLIPENEDWLGSGVGAKPAEDPWSKQYSASDHRAAEHDFFRPPNVMPGASSPAAATIPDDWDLLAPPAGPPMAAPQQTPPPAAQPFSAQPAAQPFSPQPPAQPFPAPPTAPPFPAPPARQAPYPEATVLPRSAPASAAPAVQAIPAQPMPAQPTPGPAARPPPMPAPRDPPSASGAGGDLAFRAFLEGAGVSPETLAGQNAAALMRALGQTFREMAVGLRDVLTTRAMVKTEFRVEQTMIRSSNNNALKFSATPEDAVAALVGPTRQGYMPAQKAVQEGFKDVKAHELALMAGMQVAVAALLKQFDPEQLKKRLEQNSILHSIVPGARKAKYWEIYEQQYKKIAGEVSEDVNGTFGRAFARAYEEQVKKL